MWRKQASIGPCWNDCKSDMYLLKIWHLSCILFFYSKSFSYWNAALVVTTSPSLPYIGHNCPPSGVIKLPWYHLTFPTMCSCPFLYFHSCTVSQESHVFISLWFWPTFEHISLRYGRLAFFYGKQAGILLAIPTLRSETHTHTHTQIPGSWDTQTQECLCDNDELARYFNTRHWICNPFLRWDYICLDVYTRLRVSRGRADVDVGGRSLVHMCYLCYGFKPWQDTSNHIVSNETQASIGRSVLSPSPVIHPISPKLPPPSWQNVDPLGRPSGH